MPTATRYRRIAQDQLRGASPSYERLCLGVADDDEVIARLDTVPEPKRQPNLLLGVVRWLGGPVDSYAGFRTFVLDRWDEVAEALATKRTQTNEPRRCATLLPALAALPQPLALLEVDAAVELSRADPVTVQPGDLTRDVAALAAQAPRSATLVIFHSAVLAYLDAAGRDAFRRQVADIAARRPTVWLANEGPGIVVPLDVPPGPLPFVLTRDGQPLALTAPHGQWLEWRR